MHRFNLLYFILLNALSYTLLGQDISKLGPDEFEKKIKGTGEIQLVDVRTKKEFQEGHIKEALNMDYNSSEFTKLVVHLDKNKPTYVYCLSGGRSSAALKLLKENGFKEVYELEGGMRKWKEAGKPYDAETEKRAGLSISDFEKMLQKEGLILVDFGAPWCAPCKKMAPFIESVSKDKTLNTEVIKIDVDEHEQLSKDLKVGALPTLHFYKNQKLLDTHSGFLSETELRERIKKLNAHK